MDIIQQVADVFAFVQVVKMVAVVVEFNVDGMGVAEQVVHVAQDFLISADHEEANKIGLLRINFMHGERFFKILAVDVLVDAAIGIAGQILYDRAASGLFV